MQAVKMEAEELKTILLRYFGTNRSGKIAETETQETDQRFAPRVRGRLPRRQV